MSYSADQILNGLINYADHEVMDKLPTTGKWVMGTTIGLMTNKANTVIDNLRNNSIVKMLGIIDDDGNIDADALITALKSSADRYGKITVEVPLVGKLSFSSNDVESLRTYLR